MDSVLARGESGGRADLEVLVARLLVVDDDELVRRALVRVLVGLGHEVESTGSPVDALERASNMVPDLLVTDYTMPSMTGLTLAARLRGVLGERCPPVLFVSGSSVEDAVKKAVLELRVAFVAKPFDSKMLSEEVRALLGTKM